MEILTRLHAVAGDEPFIFISQLSRGKPISEDTLNGFLRRLGYGKDAMTSHGFRANASSLLNESGKWHPDAIDDELAHMGADQIREAAIEPPIGTSASNCKKVGPKKLRVLRVIYYRFIWRREVEANSLTVKQVRTGKYHCAND